MVERIEKMDRRALAAMAIAVVAGLLIFGAITGVIRQAGWNEGFLAGLMNSRSLEAGSTAAGEMATPYYAARGHGMHGWGWHPFWIIGGFFRFLFFGFLIMLFFKFIARRRWAHHGGHGPGGHGPWGQHGRHHWGAQGTQEQSDTPEGPSDPLSGESHRPQQTGWTQV